MCVFPLLVRLQSPFLEPSRRAQRRPGDVERPHAGALIGSPSRAQPESQTSPLLPMSEDTISEAGPAPSSLSHPQLELSH